MLTSPAYARFAEVLAARGTTMRTSAARYRAAHEVPGWYPTLASVTPDTEWTVGPERAAFADACRQLGDGAAVLRDYTKSMKQHWHEAMYIPAVDVLDAAWLVATRFLELRDDDFAGGFVVRRFEDFGAGEVRTWWRDGTCRLVGPHPDVSGDVAVDGLDVTEVAPLVAGLGLPFVTVDFARRGDGRWRVVELGDGQVSDRPRGMSPVELVSVMV